MKKNHCIAYYLILFTLCISIYMILCSDVDARTYKQPRYGTTVVRPAPAPPQRSTVSHSARPYYHPHGHSVTTLPAGYRQVVVGGNPYYYHGGVYYSRGPSGYVVVNAPVGAAVPGLPPGYSTVYYGGREYYMANGVYYSRGPSGYVVTRTPVGAYVNTLPPGYRTVNVNGQPQYVVNGVYYRQQVRDGRRGYVVVR